MDVSNVHWSCEIRARKKTTTTLLPKSANVSFRNHLAYVPSAALPSGRRVDVARTYAGLRSWADFQSKSALSRPRPIRTVTWTNGERRRRRRGLQRDDHNSHVNGNEKAPGPVQNVRCGACMSPPERTSAG